MVPIFRYILVTFVSETWEPKPMFCSIFFLDKEKRVRILHSKKTKLNRKAKKTWKNETNNRKKMKGTLKLPKKIQAELQAIKQTKELERKEKYWVSEKKVDTTDLLNSPCQDAYTKNASYGKAITKVKRTLPESPRKKVLL